MGARREAGLAAGCRCGRGQRLAARKAASSRLGAEVTALATAGDTIYAGSSDGRLWVSIDRGRNWNAARAGRPRAGGSDLRRSARPARGAGRAGREPARRHRAARAADDQRRAFWDDLTADLPETPAYGIAADRATGTVYVATGRGVFMTHAALDGRGSRNVLDSAGRASAKRRRSTSGSTPAATSSSWPWRATACMRRWRRTGWAACS